MALSIKNAETERLAREVAQQTGESITSAIHSALRERLQQLRRKRTSHANEERIKETLCRLDRMSRRNNKSADEILGYDESGLPH
jgi:antitoxin VapB